MGENGNRIFMALLTGVFIVLSFSFLNVLLFHKADYPIIGGDAVVTTVVDTADNICPLLATADAGLGETIAKANCTACHNFSNEIAGTGPHLVAVVDRDIAGTDFAYSSAMAGVPGDWTYDQLNEFLFQPGAYIPGTKMNFAGWDDSKINIRANVIAYLYAASDIALPSDCPVDAADDTADSDEMADDMGDDMTEDSGDASGDDDGVETTS